MPCVLRHHLSLHFECHLSISQLLFLFFLISHLFDSRPHASHLSVCSSPMSTGITAMRLEGEGALAELDVLLRHPPMFCHSLLVHSLHPSFVFRLPLLRLPPPLFFRTHSRMRHTPQALACTSR